LLNPRLCRSNRAIFSITGSICAGLGGYQAPQGARRWPFRTINPAWRSDRPADSPLQTGRTRRKVRAKGISLLVICIDGNQPSLHLREGGGRGDSALLDILIRFLKGSAWNGSAFRFCRTADCGGRRSLSTGGDRTYRSIQGVPMCDVCRRSFIRGAAAFAAAGLFSSH